MSVALYCSFVPSNGGVVLNLSESAVYRQFNAGYVAAVTAAEKHHGLCDFVWSVEPTEWNCTDRWGHRFDVRTGAHLGTCIRVYVPLTKLMTHRMV